MFPAQYYYPIYIYIILIWSLIQGIQYSKMKMSKILYIPKSSIFITLFSILFIVIVGLRPVSGKYFGDTINYAHSYSLLQENISLYDQTHSEWLFHDVMASCATLMDVEGFFLIIEAGYVLLMFWTCRRLIPNNITLAMLFCFGAFSFFSYGVNGIRNGLACNFVLLALSYIKGNNKEKVIACVLCFIAYSIHNSTVLPIACMFISAFYQKTKFIYAFWIGAIFISAVAGGAVEHFFTGLGFDDRLGDYLHNRDNDALFSSTGFRWNFLLYSAMPICLGWYVIFKKKVYNTQYLLLLHTYILANAFWVMLIRASYSNRFAYLSWFMYPIVLAYPLLVIPLWKNQGKNVGIILIFHALFTYIMWIRG